jgi:type I restriction enzyme M protein
VNLVLHGIGSEATHVPVIVNNALVGKHGQYEMVRTNSPFGKKSSVTLANETSGEEKQSLVVHRDDFWASTGNKQLNLLQHVFPTLKHADGD